MRAGRGGRWERGVKTLKVRSRERTVRTVRTVRSTSDGKWKCTNTTCTCPYLMKVRSTENRESFACWGIPCSVAVFRTEYYTVQQDGVWSKCLSDCNWWLQKPQKANTRILRVCVAWKIAYGRRSVANDWPSIAGLQTPPRHRHRRSIIRHIGPFHSIPFMSIHLPPCCAFFLSLVCDKRFSGRWVA